MGRTELIPKPGCSGQPDQLSPITCLNTGYKLLTLLFELGRGRGSVCVELEFHRGLFQGDSLSPLLYCLCIAPLSDALGDG